MSSLYQQNTSDLGFLGRDGIFVLIKKYHNIVRKLCRQHAQ